MLRFLRWSVVAVFGLTASACATMTVSSHVERGLNFTQYHTWQWAPADSLPESDARLDNAFFQDHFQGAVEREMNARGFTQTVSEGDVPDLLVHYHANVSQRINVNHGDQSVGACYDGDCTVRVLDTDLGTMMIDVVDGHTNRLVWRGWAQNSIEGVVNNPSRFQANIQKAVKRMFARFPRTI